MNPHVKITLHFFRWNNLCGLRVFNEASCPPNKFAIGKYFISTKPLVEPTQRIRYIEEKGLWHDQNFDVYSKNLRTI